MSAERSPDLAHDRYVSLATFRRDGREVRTPVWVAADPAHPAALRGFVWTNGRSGKAKRIRANGRARVATCDARGGGCGRFATARARVLSEPAAMAPGFAALRAKYGWQLALGLGLARLGGRYADRVIVELSLEGV